MLLTRGEPCITFVINVMIWVSSSIMTYASGLRSWIISLYLFHAAAIWDAYNSHNNNVNLKHAES